MKEDPIEKLEKETERQWRALDECLKEINENTERIKAIAKYLDVSIKLGSRYEVQESDAATLRRLGRSK